MTAFRRMRVVVFAASATIVLLVLWIIVSLIDFSDPLEEGALDAPGRVGVEFVVVEERLSVSVRGRGVVEPVSVVEVGLPSFEGPGSVTAPPVVGRIIGSYGFRPPRGIASEHALSRWMSAPASGPVIHCDDPSGAAILAAYSGSPC